MLEHKQRRLSPIDSRRERVTYVDSAGAPEAEDLQQRLSAVSLTPSEDTRSNHLSKDEGRHVIHDQVDSGYASIASSPDFNRTQFVAHDLPGTTLKYFIMPISEELKARFFDIKILYSQPLIDVISKKRSSPGDVSMKLKYLGSSEETARLYIVIQCGKNVSKRVKKFFAQDHVKEELKTDFCVFVHDQELLRLAAGNAIDVLTDSWPEETLCGMPIKMTRDNASSIATLGGLVMVETSSKKCLYGLTAGHPLKRLGSSNPEMLETNEDSDSDCSDVGGEFASYESIESVPCPLNKNLEVRNAKLSSNTRIIGKITCHSFNRSTKENYDWALVDLESLQLKPNALVLKKPGSFLELERRTVTWISSSTDTDSTPKHVVVITKRGPQSGVLAFNGSCLLMRPGSMFVHTYDLTMSAASCLTHGDSGSLVVDEGTGSVYGHVVSVDAFGEGQVMPISLTLESIKTRLDAVRVWLPTYNDVRAAAMISRYQVKCIVHGISSSSFNPEAETCASPAAPWTIHSIDTPDQSACILLPPQTQSPACENRDSGRIHRSSDRPTPSELLQSPQVVYDHPAGSSPCFSTWPLRFDQGCVLGATEELEALVFPSSSQPTALQPFHSGLSTEPWDQPQQQQQGGPHGQPTSDLNGFCHERFGTDSGYVSVSTSPQNSLDRA